MSAQGRGAAYARLRAARPAALAALLEDGDARELALGAGKGKWDKALATAKALGATALELRDAEGAVMEILVLEERGEDGAPDARTPSGTGELERVLKLCADFADRATQRQQALLESVVDTSIQVMKASADRAERSERALDKVLRAHEKVLMTRPGDGGEGMNATDVMAMMAAMMAGGGKPDLSGLLGSGEAAPPNGQDEMVLVPKAVVQRVQAYLAANGGPEGFDG